MSQFDRRKFLITGTAVLGASGIAAGIGWWYRAQRMPADDRHIRFFEKYNARPRAGGN